MEKIEILLQEIKSDIKGIKAGQEKIEKEVSELKSELTGIKSDITLVKSDQQEVREELKISKEKIQEHEGRIVETSQNLNLLSTGLIEISDRVSNIETTFELLLVKVPDAMAGALMNPMREFSETFKDGFGKIIHLLSEKDRRSTSVVKAAVAEKMPYDRGKSKSPLRALSPSPKRISHSKDRAAKFQQKKLPEMVERAKVTNSAEDFSDSFNKSASDYMKFMRDRTNQLISFIERNNPKKRDKSVARKKETPISSVGGGYSMSDEVFENFPEPEGGWATAFDPPEVEEYCPPYSAPSSEVNSDDARSESYEAACYFAENPEEAEAHGYEF